MQVTLHSLLVVSGLRRVDRALRHLLGHGRVVVVKTAQRAATSQHGEGGQEEGELFHRCVAR